MEKPFVLIVGRDFSNLRLYLDEHGYDFIVLRDVITAKNIDKPLKRRVICDFSSKASILKTVDMIKRPIHAVISTYESYILPTAWINDHLGLPGISPESAEICTDKELMRQNFATAPIKISPAFAVITSQDELISFTHTHSFPFILKPANLAKSLLVTKSDNLTELLRNYSAAMASIEQLYKKYVPNRPPKLLIEEFLEGTIHSVDAFIDSEGEPHVLDQIVDYQTGYDIGYDDNFHYSRLVPSRLSKTDQDALRNVAAVGCESLKMRSTPAHIEIIMTHSGPRIVEIGARNGGYRERMHRLAHDIDITGAALALAFGKQPQIHALKNEPCAVIELFPKNPGIFKEIVHESQLKELASYRYSAIKVDAGQFVGKAGDGYKMCAVIILHHENNDIFNSDLSYVNSSVYVETTVD